MNRKTIIMAAILLGALLVLPVVACSPQESICPPGEELRCHNECYDGFGPWHIGRCYDQSCCQETATWIGWFYRTRPQHEICECIAVTCPAIPCNLGYSCEGGQCVPIQGYCDEQNPCIERFHCVETQCTPDICGQDFQCDAGQECGPDNTCVTVPVTEKPRSNFSPYTEPTCLEVRSTTKPLTYLLGGQSIESLPLLELKDTWLGMNTHYVSETDCAGMASFSRGEPSYSKDCTAVEWYNREEAMDIQYGGMPNARLNNPAGAVCFFVVKNSPKENTLPVFATATDSHYTTVPVLSGTAPVIIQCYRLPEGFSECRLR